MSDTNSKASIDIYHWAYINFEIQSLLLQDACVGNARMEDALSAVGYDGASLSTLGERQQRELIQEEGFFGTIQTGNRIVTFALKKSGLDKTMFDYVEEGINSAYEAVLITYGKNDLSKASHTYSLQALAVFRP